jgi:hypothetical protein|tara:strand:+ start:1964 stop:2125 length:162 start_codon:yes stop_codon:yes gene_type:complete
MISGIDPVRTIWKWAKRNLLREQISIRSRTSGIEAWKVGVKAAEADCRTKINP